MGLAVGAVFAFFRDRGRVGALIDGVEISGFLVGLVRALGSLWASGYERFVVLAGMGRLEWALG